MRQPNSFSSSGDALRVGIFLCAGFEVGEGGVSEHDEWEGVVREVNEQLKVGEGNTNVGV